MPADKDTTFAERDEAGRKRREHDTIPVKVKGTVKDIPRRTEREALDLAAYGELQDMTHEQIEAELFRSGKFAYCSRCGAFLPADNEPGHFRTASDRRGGWRQPCQDCARELTQRRRAENAHHRYWKKSGKFRAGD